jgi:hypothetical protein
VLHEIARDDGGEDPGDLCGGIHYGEYKPRVTPYMICVCVCM